MGLSHVTAAALVYAGLTFTAFGITTDLFEHDAEVDASWQKARQLEDDLLRTALSISDVQRTGNRITITIENTGATTLHAASLTVLIDGVPATVSSYTVEGATNAVWPAHTQAELVVMDNRAPSSVAVATAHGAMAYWRS